MRTDRNVQARRRVDVTADLSGEPANEAARPVRQSKAEYKAMVTVIALGVLAIMLLVAVFLLNMDWTARPWPR
jgi:hypothetical protein